MMGKKASLDEEISMKKTLGRLYREVEVYLINLDGWRNHFAFKLDGWNREIWGIVEKKWGWYSRSVITNLTGIGTFCSIYLGTNNWGCLDTILGNRIKGFNLYIYLGILICRRNRWFI